LLEEQTGRKEEGTEAEENSATSGEDQIAQAQVCFILLKAVAGK